MLFANNINGDKIEAEPNSKAICPMCNQKVISKCGEIKVWHWAHKSLIDCDSWGEGETEWHINWKKLVDKKFCEIKKGNHRIDIFINNKVIELQNSPIQSYDIFERENFYKNMIWLFNGETFGKNLDLRIKIPNGIIYINAISPPFGYRTFRWKWFPLSLSYCKLPIFIDFGAGIFNIKKIYCNGRCSGWGYLLSKQEFINRYLKNA